MDHSETIHVEVYLKNKNDVAYLAYEVEDNDVTILFSAFILKECIHEFTHDDRVLILPAELIKKRTQDLKKQFKSQLPSNVEYKITSLINFIETNEKNYCGVRTVYKI